MNLLEFLMTGMMNPIQDGKKIYIDTSDLLHGVCLLDEHSMINTEEKETKNETFLPKGSAEDNYNYALDQNFKETKNSFPPKEV